MDELRVSEEDGRVADRMAGGTVLGDGAHMKRILLAHIIFVAAAPSLTLAQVAAERKEPCSEITAVRHIPFHPEDRVDDPAYNELIKKSWSVVPCLISEITNSSLTPDPRSAPIYPKVRLGDVAFWILKDITNLPYDEMFPAAVSRRFPKEGVYVYFHWVNRDANRRKLQQNVEKWCALHRPKGNL